MLPTLLTITATDSSAGAGTLADIKVAHDLGVHCQAVVVAVTAQSSAAAIAVQPQPLQIIQSQYHAAVGEQEPKVIRLGWLPLSHDFLSWLVDALDKTNATVLWDPVVKASQGGALNQDWQSPPILALVKKLLARVDCLTPNHQEAQRLHHWLYGEECTDEQRLAERLQRLGRFHLLLTGIKQQAGVADYFSFNPANPLGQHELPGASLMPQFYFIQPTLSNQKHGTGCHLIAQLACRLSLGVSWYDALTQAVAASKRYLLNHPSVTEQSAIQYWPKVMPATQPLATKAFRPLTKPLGLYGLVDNIEHLKRLLALGIDSLQWRVKQPQTHYSADTQTAIELCHKANVPLFINDDWELAIQLGADGVHLGQEDLNSANLYAIQQAGLRLGVSTHTDWEIARARALKPSYIALGPIFKPLSKTLKYSPLGVDLLAQYVRRYPEHTFTCIGGITQKNASSVWNTGVQSIAVVTDLANNTGLEKRLQHLRSPS